MSILSLIITAHKHLTWIFREIIIFMIIPLKLGHSIVSKTNPHLHLASGGNLFVFY